MMARVVAPNDWENVGAHIEVVGFVSHSGVTYAVWRDDYGALYELPMWAIRMTPAVVPSPQVQDDQTLGMQA